MPTSSTTPRAPRAVLALLGLLCAAPVPAATPLEAALEATPVSDTLAPTASLGLRAPPVARARPGPARPRPHAAASGIHGRVDSEVGASAARSPLRALPAAGPGAWRELSSPNFRVLTDARAALGRALIAELELLRASLVTPLGLGSGAAQGGIDVILFADREDYVRFAGQGSVAKTSWRTERPLMLLAARGVDEGPRRSLLTHELTHALSRAALGRQPRWVAEGLAEVLERMQLSPDGTRASLPAADTSPRWTEPAARLLPLSALWRWDLRLPPRAELPRYYASAWGWTSFLGAQHPARLAAFHRALGEGVGARRAFSSAFDGLAPDELWREARAWLGRGRSAATSWSLVGGDPGARITQVALSGADATVVLAWLRLLGFDGRSIAERRELAGRALAQVLEVAPGHGGAAHLHALLAADWASEEAALSELR